MIQRRAVSTVVAGLIALVAILGTTVYFISGNAVFTNLNQPQHQENTQTTQNSPVTSQSNTQTTQNSPVTSQSSQTQSTTCGSRSIRVSNVHTWVSSNGQTVTAFAIQNTGCATSIDTIALRGISVPQSSWYSCGPSCGTSTNVNTKLTPDYDPDNGVNLASGMTAFTAGPISLELGQATIVYLPNAGSLQPIDAGNTYALQVVAGQASAVQQVLVVSTT